MNIQYHSQSLNVPLSPSQNHINKWSQMPLGMSGESHYKGVITWSFFKGTQFPPYEYGDANHLSVQRFSPSYSEQERL